MVTVPFEPIMVTPPSGPVYAPPAGDTVGVWGMPGPPASVEISSAPAANAAPEAILDAQVRTSTIQAELAAVASAAGAAATDFPSRSAANFVTNAVADAIHAVHLMTREGVGVGPTTTVGWGPGYRAAMRPQPRGRRRYGQTP